MLDELAPITESGEEVFKPLIDNPNKALIEAQNTLGVYSHLHNENWSDAQRWSLLASELAKLPLTQDDQESIVLEMELNPGMVAWDRLPVNTWRSIVERTYQEGKSVSTLIGTAISTFHDKYGDPDSQGEKQI